MKLINAFTLIITMLNVAQTYSMQNTPNPTTSPTLPHSERASNYTKTSKEKTIGENKQEQSNSRRHTHSSQTSKQNLANTANPSTLSICANATADEKSYAGLRPEGLKLSEESPLIPDGPHVQTMELHGKPGEQPCVARTLLCCEWFVDHEKYPIGSALHTCCGRGGLVGLARTLNKGKESPVTACEKGCAKYCSNGCSALSHSSIAAGAVTLLVKYLEKNNKG